MALDLEHGDVIAYMAFGSADGDDRITFRYSDGSTKTFEAGLFTNEDEANDTPTWWR